MGKHGHQRERRGQKLRGEEMWLDGEIARRTDWLAPKRSEMRWYLPTVQAWTGFRDRNGGVTFRQFFKQIYELGIKHCPIDVSCYFNYLVRLPSWTLIWVSEGSFPGSTSIVLVHFVHQSNQGYPGDFTWHGTFSYKGEPRGLLYNIQPDGMQNTINWLKQSKTKQ